MISLSDHDTGNNNYKQLVSSCVGLMLAARKCPPDMMTYLLACTRDWGYQKKHCSEMYGPTRATGIMALKLY